MWDHSIRTGCVALSAASPQTGEYNYIAAPRKASGPDIRWLYLGAEGLLGAILDATLVAWKPVESRLFILDDGIRPATDFYTYLHDLGVRITWAHWSSGGLKCAVHEHERVLKGIERELKSTDFAYETAGQDEVDALRRELEVGHPERRSLATAKRSMAIYLSLNDLAASIEALEEVAESIEVWDWTRHRATAIARFKKGEQPSELPAAAAAVALQWRPLVDDEAIHWPAWAQSLKNRLDPERRLSVGP